MVSKIFLYLITLPAILSAINLLAHDNFNQVSANVGSSGLDSSHLKINHQSYFYIPNGDAIILDLTHGLHTKHIQNEMGLAYRTTIGTLGIGANLYYMHTTQPKIFLHQYSPGVELLWQDLQLTYNFYFPASRERTLRKDALAHSCVSEFGLRWMPNKEFSIGVLPFYDHLNKKWGLNSKISYTMKETFVFGVSPYFKSNGSGCLFSFGVNFGPAKGMKSTHRSNEFNYLVKHCRAKNPTISVEMPKPIEMSPLAIPTQTPIISYPISVPIPLTIDPEEEDIIAEDEKETENKEPESRYWWDIFLPSPNESIKPSEDIKPTTVPEKEGPSSKTQLAVFWKGHETDFFLIPPMLQILSPILRDPCENTGSYA